MKTPLTLRALSFGKCLGGSFPKSWLFALSLIALIGTDAAAQTINLYWDNCSAGGTRVKYFACNTNSGSHTMVASFRAPAGIDQFIANEVTMTVRTLDAVPDWWRLRNQTGQLSQCRNGALSANAAFTSGPFSCLDPYTPSVAGGIATYQVGWNVYPNVVRLLLAFAIPQGEEHPLVPGEEHYAAKVVIGNQKTVGAGACAGCDMPVAISLDQIKVVQPSGAPGGDVTIVTPDQNITVGWQGDCAYFNNELTCVTPARNGTWGAVKSLYR